MTPAENLFLQNMNFVSKRIAVLEDDGTSAWLYLTEPEVRKAVADAWVYNRIVAPPISALKSFRGGPPPVVEGFAGEKAQCISPTKHAWEFVWSEDGESVAILMDRKPIACIIAGVKGGYSRHLLKECPWGHPWSDKLFKSTFGIE